MSSEIAQLRERLQLEATALYQALYGYAAVARHEVIHNRYEAVGKTLNELKQSLGEEETAKLVMAVLEQA